MRSPTRWCVVAMLALVSSVVAGATSSEASGTVNPIGRAAVREGYRVLHVVPVPPGATRVTSIPKGLMIVVGGTPENPGPTKTDDLKEFFKVTNGAGLVAWMDQRHSTALIKAQIGTSSWGWGRGSSSDSVWNVTGTKFQMQVAYDAIDVSSGSAYLRVDVFVFWSPQFAALNGTADRIALAVTKEVPAGTRTVHEPHTRKLKQNYCTYETYRAVREPVEILTNKPGRLANMARYVNSRSETWPRNTFIGINESWCSSLQIPPPTATFVLAFYRSKSITPFAAVDGTLTVDPSPTVAVAWVRSASGTLVAKSYLQGVSLPFLTSYLK